MADLVSVGVESTPDRGEYDMAIIGAGPVGIYGAYYAGFRGLRTVVVDSLPEIGGQVVGMYPEKPILDIAGFPAVKGRDLIDGLVRQAEAYDIDYWMSTEVTELNTIDDGFQLVTATGSIRARSVVIAGGIGTFNPRPFVPGEGFLGRGVSYFVPDLREHIGRDVIVVGGGDSAFDWALHLEPIARSVTLVHRRDRFRAHRGTVERVQKSSVNMILNAEVTAVVGQDCVTGVDIHAQGAEREHFHLPAQSVIAALGFKANIGPMKQWGLNLENRNIVVNTRMETNRPRVYAAGDITEYPGKVRLISVGFGEVATAVNNAAAVLDPDAEIFPGHSTEKDS